MPILGITGGVATGKTTFCALLRERIAVEYFDTDACARVLLEHDPHVRAKVTREIHPAVYDSQGRPDRALLREIVFRDTSLKQRLESILHPLIRAAWTKRAQEATTAGKIFLLDIPLLFETGAERLFDRIVTVACSLKTQRARLLSRPALSPQIAETIIAAQMPASVKMQGAHHVIWTEGPTAALAAQASLFSHYLHARYG